MKHFNACTLYLTDIWYCYRSKNFFFIICLTVKFQVSVFTSKGLCDNTKIPQKYNYVQLATHGSRNLKSAVTEQNKNILLILNSE